MVLRQQFAKPMESRGSDNKRIGNLLYMADQNISFATRLTEKKLA